MKVYRQIKHEAGVVLMMRKWTIVFSLVVALPLTILSNEYFVYQNVVWAFVGHFLALEGIAYFVGRRFTFLHGAYVLFQKRKRQYRRLRRSINYMQRPFNNDPSLEEQREVLHRLYVQKSDPMKYELKLLLSYTTAEG